MASSLSILPQQFNPTNTSFPSAAKLLKQTQIYLVLLGSARATQSPCRKATARQQVDVCTSKKEEEAEEAAAKIRRLQNGPDVRGVAMEGETGREVDLTPQAVQAIAESFGEWVVDGIDKASGGGAREARISLGRVPRVSDDGFTPTIHKKRPQILHAERWLDCEQICDRAANKYAKWVTLGSPSLSTLSQPNPTVTSVDFMPAYAQFLLNIIKQRVNHLSCYDTPLQGFKIIVNAGNGSGGFFAWDVLEKLGADTNRSLNPQTDGMFPNHIPNPEDKVAMALTRAAVLERVAHLVLREHSGTTIVTDARTSVALTRFISGNSGNHCLYRVGYRNVIDKGVQLNKDGIEVL